MIEIAPSILNSNLMLLHKQLPDLETAGVHVLHVDVMDGHFVPPITFGAPLIEALRSMTNVFIEAHLMIERPDAHVDTFVKAGCNRLIFHSEATAHAHRVAGQIRGAGAEAGIGINPATPVSAVEEVLDLTDLVLVMTVNPGWGGQKFITSCLEKVRKVRGMLDSRGLKSHIEVDGGVNFDTAAGAVKAGADVLVAGSCLFASKDPAEAFRKLTELARGASR